jgi:L-threonylcarbamoyladenylate synthase
MSELQRAVDLLRAGELVAFPTETVYGLGADARNADAVGKIFAAKGRPADHPLIVHIPDATQLSQWAIDIPAVAHSLAAAFWPGPLTLILKRAADVPDLVTGGQDTIGLRVPNHPIALDLLRHFNGGLAAPSANRFGHISPTTAAHVAEELGDRVPLILDGGPCAVGIESTILDLSRGPPEILRPGAIGVEAIAHVIGSAPRVSSGAAAPRVSGSLEAHYAPRTPLKLLAGDALPFAVRHAMVANERVAILACMPPAITDERIVWRIAPTDAVGFARELYSHLRDLDAAGCAHIIVQRPPGTELWRAVNDRLRRAAAGSGQP